MKTKEKEVRARREELEVLLELFQKAQEEEIALEQAVKELRFAIKEAEDATIRYEKDYALFLSEQAGLLAKDLKEGVPCPVCGACEHPKIAILKEEAPTQAVIEEEKKKSDEAKERSEQGNLIVAAQREKAKALKNQRLEQWERCMQETDEKEDAAENENNLNKKQEKVKEMLADAKKLEEEVKKEALELLERVGLKDKANSFPRQLSGGQKQRVAIVRALCMHPEILLFDEVTAALDPEMVREVLDVMLQLAEQGKTMLIVTHEMQFARAIADRVIFLEGGKIVEDSDPETFFDHPKTERAKQFLNVFTFEHVKHKTIKKD